MTRSTAIFLAFTLILNSRAVVKAFSPGVNERNHIMCGQSKQRTRLSESPESANTFGGEPEGLEKARKILTQLWQKNDDDQVTEDGIGDGNRIPAKKLIRLLLDHSKDDNISNLDAILPHPPPLTTAERDRRLAELKLLERLAYSDEVARDLKELWSSERGAGGKERLEQAMEMLEAGQVIAAENMLMKLIDDYGASWVEPLNQLATVYFRQGRFEQCYQLSACVLQLKPWHFGTLEGIVTVTMRLCDRDKARGWAEKGLPRLVASSSLPPFTGAANPKRAQWVQDAIKKAQEAMSHLEYQTQRAYLGNPEEYYSVSTTTGIKEDKQTRGARSKKPEKGEKPQQVILEEETDAWQ